MATTKIEWAKKVWNPITGCSPVSAGCENCYAEKFAKRLQSNPRTRDKYKNGFEPTFHDECLIEPYKWKKPSMIFVCSMGDLFHEKITFEQLDFIFSVTQKNLHHTFILLTKRPQNTFNYYNSRSIKKPFTNIWLGTSVENQKTALERIPPLLYTPAKLHFISAEPLLGPLDLSAWLFAEPKDYPLISSIDWIISGGETGPDARPMNPDWVRLIRKQCLEYRTPLFFKGWGGNKKRTGNLLDGIEWNEMPKI